MLPTFSSLFTVCILWTVFYSYVDLFIDLKFYIPCCLAFVQDTVCYVNTFLRNCWQCVPSGHPIVLRCQILKCATWSLFGHCCFSNFRGQSISYCYFSILEECPVFLRRFFQVLEDLCYQQSVVVCTNAAEAALGKLG